MPRRKSHQRKEIEGAIRHAEALGWEWRKGAGHAWGILRCPWNDEECRCGEYCQISVWSTPRNPGNHARQIRRVVDGCIHVQERQAARKKRQAK
jgi:hypothetical protein